MENMYCKEPLQEKLLPGLGCQQPSELRLEPCCGIRGEVRRKSGYVQKLPY